jgi:hypothetical protein
MVGNGHRRVQQAPPVPIHIHKDPKAAVSQANACLHAKQAHEKLQGEPCYWANTVRATPWETRHRLRRIASGKERGQGKVPAGGCE